MSIDPTKLPGLLNDADRIRDAVIAHYLKTGKPVTRMGLVEVSKLSMGRINAALTFHHGSVPGTQYTKVERERRSKSYPMMVVGHSQVDAWRPTLETLRQTILQLQKVEA